MASLSLNTKLVLLITSISGSAIAALSLISIDIMQQTLKNDASLRLNVIASDRVQTLKSVWNLRLQQVETLAADTSLQTLLSTGDSDAKSVLKTEVVEGVISDFSRLTMDKGGEIYDIQVVDSQGRIIISMDASKEGQIIKSQVFLDGLTRSHYSIEYDADNERGMLVAASPVRSEAVKPLGVTIVTRDINAANNILTDKRFLGETGEIYLVNSEGLIMTDSRFVKEARYNTVINTLPFSNCFGKEGADINGALYMNYRNTAVFGASQCERNIGIVLISELENSELFEPILTLQKQYTMIAIAIVIGSSAVAVFLSISILKPMNKLRSVMKKVQDGEFTKTDIVRRDEIGDLAKSFNAMVEEIGIRAKRLRLNNDILSFMSSRLEVQAQELVKADREKEEFAAMIAHESKLVLVPIIGYSELLLDGTLGELEQKYKAKIQIMLERAWSLLALTQNILDARRLESGDLKMNMQSGVSPEQLVEKCAAKVRPIIESQGHRLVTRIGVNNIMIYCDRERILQVLDNLVGNAIKFSRPSAQNTIEISVRSEPGDIIFSVQDCGVGIAKDKQKELFKKFYHLDSSLTRKQGVSLGLTISKSIIESHGGKIWMESDIIGGSLFMFSIPLAENRVVPREISGGRSS